MKRRKFGLLAGTSAAAAALVKSPAFAQATPDVSQLGTTLTPVGAERAGNADGSIPPWTGGVTAPQHMDTPIDTAMFPLDKILYTITADNLAQYQDQVPAGIQYQITKWGMKINVYETHRSAAMPQYVYDNIKLNATRAKLNPAGGRLGFTGAYGGAPFPIIDTSDPDIAGGQLIWNHLTAWAGYYSTHTAFSPSFVVESGRSPVMSTGETTNFVYPYYDPNGSLETYQGYFGKLHAISLAPANIQGQELMNWHTSNVSENPDIAWTLLNGEGRVRKAPDEAFDTPEPSTNGINNIDESNCFYGSPQQYDWKFIEKKEMVIPYNNNMLRLANWQDVMTQHFINPDLVRWEKHRVWIVEATLHPGERNVNHKRRFYIDEDTWWAITGEGYDADGDMVKVYWVLNRCDPMAPATTEFAPLVHNVQTGDYSWQGNIDWGGRVANEVMHIFPPSEFDPTAMAANASF